MYFVPTSVYLHVISTILSFIMINYSAHSSVFICENRKNASVAWMMFKRYVIYICGEQANQKLVDCNPGFMSCTVDEIDTWYS